MRFLLKPIDFQSPVLRNYTLRVLAKSLLEYCGGSGVEQQQRPAADCIVCQETPRNGATLAPGSHKTRAETGMDKSDSALSSSDASVQGDVPNVNPKWRCLKRYLPLISDSNEDISSQVAQHLLRLVSQGSEAFKQELFFSVFLPIMKRITEQHGIIEFRDGGSEEEVAGPTKSRLTEHVVHYCLSALPLMLTSKSAQDLFLNCGGLRQLCQLFLVKAFRKCVLRVFQVLIMLEDQRKLLEASKRTSLGSLDQKSGDRSQDNTDTPDSESGLGYSHCEDNVVEAFVKLLMQDSEQLEPESFQDSGRKESDPSDDLSIARKGSDGSSSATASEPEVVHPFEESVSTLTESGDMMDNAFPDATSLSLKLGKIDVPQDKTQLTVVCDVWNACATLLPYSQIFQQCFVEADGPHIAYDLLVQCIEMILSRARNGTIGLLQTLQPRDKTKRDKNYAHPERKKWLHLMESTLVVCLTSSKLQNVHQVSLSICTFKFGKKLRDFACLRRCFEQSHRLFMKWYKPD